jgi:feruloyl esterase
MKILAWGAIIATVAVLSVEAQPSTGGCEALAGLKLPQVAITQAVTIAAHAPLPAYCKILGSAHPTSDSDIRFEVAIPEEGAWNGRYLQVGNGGFAGVIPEAGILSGLAQGYAVAGTDDGHQDTNNTDASWALGHPEKQIDFGYRALKETTDAAKAIIQTYRGSAPRFSYFQGCSDGGREALMEAQRYPKDFDGIIAGDPANNWIHLFAGAAWGYQALTATPGSYLTAEKLKLIEAEAVKQCGDQDGVIEDPLSCRFKPEKLLCRAGDNPSCLTKAQLTALRKIYDGPRNPRTGEKIIAGFSPGGEGEVNGWERWITGEGNDPKQALIYQFVSNFFRYVVRDEPDFDVTRINFDGDIAAADKKFGPIFSSYDPDLSAFRSHGGKLIQYHGWADPAIPALDSVDYYRLVQKKMGPTEGFYRLFMVPGMLHCRGGPGPNAIAALPALASWVEHNKAPDFLVATKYQGDDPAAPVVRQRPLCSFPARAAWDGRGDRSKLESYRCVAPRQ